MKISSMLIHIFVSITDLINLHSILIGQIFYFILKFWFCILQPNRLSTQMKPDYVSIFYFFDQLFDSGEGAFSIMENGKENHIILLQSRILIQITSSFESELCCLWQFFISLATLLLKNSDTNIDPLH